MFDSLMVAISIGVASFHPEAHDVQAPEIVEYSSAPSLVRTDAADQMVKQLNDMRAANGLSRLTFQTNLADIAREHGQEMISEHYFGHRSPQGLTLQTRFAQHGMHADLIGENLAWCSTVQEAAIDLWQSEEHQQNERDGRFHHVGVAAIETGDRGTLFVQIFTE